MPAPKQKPQPDYLTDSVLNVSLIGAARCALSGVAPYRASRRIARCNIFPAFLAFLAGFLAVFPADFPEENGACR